MKLIAMLFVGLMVLACGLRDCLADSITHFYDNKSYEFELTSEKFYRAPKWNPQKSKHPPYPANKALGKAEEFIKRFPPKEGQEWAFEGLSLKPLKTSNGSNPYFPKSVRHTETVIGWVWCGTYRLRPSSGGATGYWPSISCYILMDGSVVEPTVSPQKLNVRSEGKY